MPTILSFDTATNACSVALQVGDKIYSRHEIAPRKHAVLLLQMIDELLRSSGVSRSDLEAVAFGCGPGSFMGARLAVGMAQGLAFGLSIPVIPVSTLQTIAQTAYQQKQSKQILAGWDARMGDIYWGVYEASAEGVMCPVVEDALSAPNAISPDCLADDFLVAGNAWSVYEDQLSQTLLDRVKSRVIDCYPEAEAMLIIAQNEFMKGQVMAPEQATPSYLRDKVTN